MFVDLNMFVIYGYFEEQTKISGPSLNARGTHCHKMWRPPLALDGFKRGLDNGGEVYQWLLGMMDGRLELPDPKVLYLWIPVSGGGRLLCSLVLWLPGRIWLAVVLCRMLDEVDLP